MSKPVADDIPSRLIKSFLAVAAAAGGSVIAGFRLATVLPAAYVVLVFLMGVLLVAATLGLRAGIAAAFASFFAFNFFFVEPTYTFNVADPKDVFALAVFLVVAILTGGLAGRLREVADAARRRAEMLALLHDFAERVAATDDLGVIRDLVVRRVAERIDGTAVLVERWEAAREHCAGWPELAEFTSDERRSIDRAFSTGQTIAAAAPGYAERRFEFRPLTTAGGIVAVVGLAPGSGARRIGAEDEQGLAALLEHAATALERGRFARETAAAEAAAEQERLRSALLASISHDLRTPLATILGSVTSLRQLGDRMQPAERADLLEAIEEEADRLSRFVADLLAMTRLEAGLDVRRDWTDVGDALRAAVAHLRRVHPGHPVEIEVAAGLPPVRADATLLEQVLFNLGDNAAKASPSGAAVGFRASMAGGCIAVAITDRGRGMSGAEIARLFQQPIPALSGLAPQGQGGLGLVIVRRVVEAMGGTIWAEAPIEAGGGTRVEVRLPVEKAGLPVEPDGSER